MCPCWSVISSMHSLVSNLLQQSGASIISFYLPIVFYLSLVDTNSFYACLCLVCVLFRYLWVVKHWGVQYGDLHVPLGEVWWLSLESISNSVSLLTFFCNGGAVRLVGCYWTWLANATALLICSPHGFLEEIFYFSDCQLSHDVGSCYRLKRCA